MSIDPTTKLALTIVLSMTAVACSGRGASVGDDVLRTGPNDGSAPAPPSQDGGADALAPFSPSGCPVLEPGAGDVCVPVRETLVCSYGDSAFSACRRVFACIDGTFRKTEDGLRDCPSNGCPAARADGLACSRPGDGCMYDVETVACKCLDRVPSDACTATGTSRWFCAGPESRPLACPSTLPNRGTSCGAITAACVYSPSGSVVPGPGFVSGTTALCVGGVWTWNVNDGCAGTN